MTITIAGPDSALNAIPQLIGEEPRDTVILLGIDNHRRACVAARMGIAQITDEPEAAELISDATFSLSRNEAREVVAVLYGNLTPLLDGVLPYAEQVRSIEQAVTLAGMRLADALYVHADRRWSYLCDNPQCCPPTGNAVQDEPVAFLLVLGD